MLIIGDATIIKLNSGPKYRYPKLLSQALLLTFLQYLRMFIRRCKRRCSGPVCFSFAVFLNLFSISKMALFVGEEKVYGILSSTKTMFFEGILKN